MRRKRFYLHETTEEERQGAEIREEDEATCAEDELAAVTQES